ncbi:hypothetical protein HHL19_16360 [Streptomyces sp. R302]|uniref:hypothetical protein n=1 Tax=unclassified Streptomyces TaxID=2593676 RepID=UPI00145D4BBB|nr:MULTISPECIES: hypothetical protein [unclassified Streptomyces]NML55344.1 hypothetical protein [Streptomyces sp. R301]NML80216.1 hypothetical protein [Streptomyces sp. R302]
MNATTITAGTRIRVRRYNGEGKLHFVKEGRVLEADGRFLHFHDDETGYRVWLDANPLAIGETMKGWTQAYEVI